MNKIILDMIPFIRIGPFHFNERVDNYFKLPIYEIPEEGGENSALGWKVYSLDESDIRIYVDNEKITSIACYDECIYKGENLIGKRFDRFKKIFMLEPDQIDEMDLDDGIQVVYDFYSLAMQVFTKKEKIACITVSCPYDEHNN